METKKLISVRLDPETLEKIDEFLKNRKYFTRSAIIDTLMSVIMKCTDDDTIWTMMTTSFPFEKGCTVRFEVDKDIMVNRAKQVANKF